MLLEPLLRIRVPKRGTRDPNVESMATFDPARSKRAPFLAAALSHRNFLDVSSARTAWVRGIRAMWET